MLGVPPTLSGLSISAENALRVPSVANATKAIADAIGQLPLGLYRRNPKGGKTLIQAADHPIAQLIEQPSPWVGKTEFRRQLAADCLLLGNAYAVVVRVNGEPRELHRIDPRLVAVTFDIWTNEPTYRIGIAPNAAREYAWTDMVHIRALGLNGVTGLGIVETAREAIALALVLEAHATQLFSRGAKPSGLLETAKTLSPEAVKRLRESFQETSGGVDRAGRTLVLEEGMIFKPIQLTSTDSQFLQLREFAVLEIARAFRVPPHLLQMLDRTTHSNAEELGAEFLALTLSPWLSIFEDSFHRTLIADDDKNELSFGFETAAIARADITKRFAAYSAGIESGVLTLNEARGLEGLPPVEGGDTPMRSVQTIPLSAVDPATQGAPKPQAILKAVP